MAKASLFNPKTGAREAVEVGGQRAKDLFGQGYYLENQENLSRFGRVPQDSQNTQGDAQRFAEKRSATQRAFGIPEFTNTRDIEEQKVFERQSGTQSFVDALRKALEGGDTEAKAMRQERATLANKQFTAPGAERERLVKAGITDPFARQQMIGQTIASTQSGLQDLNDILSARGQTREQAVERGIGQYQTGIQGQQLQAERASRALQEALGLVSQYDAAKAAEEARRQQLEDEQRAYQRQLALKNAGGGSGDGADAEFYQDLQNARNAIAQGADANAVNSALIGKYPTRNTAIKSGLTGAGFTLESLPDATLPEGVAGPQTRGGIFAYGPGNVPITPEAYSAGTGTPLSEVFGRSPLQSDQERARTEASNQQALMLEIFRKAAGI
jgi:hypothetical protein